MYNLKKLLSVGYISLQLLLSTTLIKAATGAGILPYMRNIAGQVFFLLSEDGHRKGVLVDFGGGGKPDEDNAVKEGHEETMGVFTNNYKEPYSHVEKVNAYKALKHKFEVKV